MKYPKHLWFIHDPADGPHVFRTEKEAKETWERWRREAAKQGHYWDTFWDMLPPAKYRFEIELKTTPSGRIKK